MLEIVRTLLEASPLLALFLAIAAGYAIGQISFAGVSFGAGAVLVQRPDHRCHCAKGGAARHGRNHRPRDVRLRGRHPIRAAVLRQPPRSRHQVHCSRGRRACSRRSASRWLLADPLGISLGDRGRIVRRLRHQHADPAGGAGRGGQPGSRRSAIRSPIRSASWGRSS